MRHILIVGRNGVGKSTLIRALLRELNAPVYGVISKKESADRDGSCPVYIHLYGAERQYNDGNRIGRCSAQNAVAYPDALDRFSEQMRFPHDGVIVLDELGFLESGAERFTTAVLKILDEAPFVIAGVRDKDTPFLNAVRAHPRAAIYRITEENRDALCDMLLPVIRVFKRETEQNV
jgi:nucleoside-triphosphatase